jgi:hypothetical protein
MEPLLFVDCLDRCAIAQRCAPSTKHPANRPKQRKREGIQQDIRAGADPNDGVSTRFVFVSIRRHEPYTARPQKDAAAASDILLESMRREEEQRRNRPKQRSD